jgi:hypothetical protein
VALHPALFCHVIAFDARDVFADAKLDDDADYRGASGRLLVWSIQ